VKQLAFLGRYMHMDAVIALSLSKTLRDQLVRATSEIMNEESEQAKIANDID